MNPPAEATIQLPLEVTGGPGTTVAVEIDLGPAPRVQALWMQVHGLEYPEEASVRLNHGAWRPLTNRTVQIAEPGHGYGGIGGGFATLKMTLPLGPAEIVAGTNLLEFRFNRTDGVTSGFRVLACNFLDAMGHQLLPPETFVQQDPRVWKPPSADPAEAAAGRDLWQHAQLIASGLPNAPPIRAHCGDCHAEDGRDLKYFNYSNQAIVARSQFHGLTPEQGRRIASYIRTLPYPNPGRPWDPPYQPGPPMATGPAANWAAGAGLAWVLDRDLDSLPYLFGGKAGPGPASFAPDGDLHAATVPIAMQLPDWNHWLPRVHPLDATTQDWASRFPRSEWYRLYRERAGSGFHDRAEAAAFFSRWAKSRDKLLPHLAVDSTKWTRAFAEDIYSAQLWQSVKTWELTQRFHLETALETYTNGTDLWQNTVPAATAPADLRIPDNASGMNGSALTNEYFSNAWYQLQMVLDSGTHARRGKDPVDWVYLAGHVRELEELSGRREPARLLLLAIKAMQSSDPRATPEDRERGWRPDQNLDPRLMVAWTSTFAGIPEAERTAITQAWLAAWLDKTLRYPVTDYFRRGQIPGAYAPPKELRAVSGGRVWEDIAEFQAAGADAHYLRRLEEWGAFYTAAAGLYHY